MVKRCSEIEMTHIGVINNQHIYFVGTAAENAFVSVSPAGMDTLRMTWRYRLA